MKSELAIRYSVLEKYKFEQIADDYAIEFSNWLFNIDKEVLKKQLNEFKKEKAL
jgi:hypothetical protein